MTTRNIPGTRPALRFFDTHEYVKNGNSGEASEVVRLKNAFDRMVERAPSLDPLKTEPDRWQREVQHYDLPAALLATRDMKTGVWIGYILVTWVRNLREKLTLGSEHRVQGDFPLFTLSVEPGEILPDISGVGFVCNGRNQLVPATVLRDVVEEKVPAIGYREAEYVSLETVQTYLENALRAAERIEERNGRKITIFG